MAGQLSVGRGAQQLLQKRNNTDHLPHHKGEISIFRAEDRLPRRGAILIATVVTFLWSTSYILNKWAFAEGIKPMTLAGLRYALAVVALASVRLALPGQGPKKRDVGSSLTFWHYLGLGVSGYLMAQGFQYFGQYYLTPTQASMVLAVGNTLQVVLIGFLWLRELPGTLQWLGITVAIVGILLYYYPGQFSASTLTGIGMILLSGLGYALQLAANRALLSRGSADAVDLVLYPMAVGAAGMVLLGWWLEPWPVLSLRLIGLLLWLGLVNGSLAFVLWTHSQRVLRSFESSMINNSMLLQIAFLDYLAFGHTPDAKALGGLVVAGIGIVIVQVAPGQGRR